LDSQTGCFQGVYLFVKLLTKELEKRRKKKEKEEEKYNWRKAADEENWMRPVKKLFARLSCWGATPVRHN
jgi:hypothetical protein